MGEAYLYITCLFKIYFKTFLQILIFVLTKPAILLKMSLGMLNRSIASMAGRASGGTYDVQEYFWGAELTKEKDTYTWNPEIEEEFSEEMQNILFLKRAILGLKAVEGERNVVTVTCKNADMEDVTHPVLSLTLGREDHCDVELTFKQVEAVTFKLVAGSGPVHLVGQHYQETMRDGMDDTEFDDEEDEDESIEEEAEAEEATKKRKMPSPAKAKPDTPNTKKLKAAKAANGEAKTNGVHA